MVIGSRFQKGPKLAQRSGAGSLVALVVDAAGVSGWARGPNEPGLAETGQVIADVVRALIERRCQLADTVRSVSQ